MDFSKSPADQRRELNSIIQETVSVSLRKRLESLLLDIDKEIQVLPYDKKPEAAASTRPAHTELPATEFVAIERFAWDYNDKNVKVYILSGLDGVHELPEGSIKLDCTKSKFDLRVLGLHGKNYRLLQSPLDKDIDPENSKFKVKKDKITLFLRKADKWSHFMNLVDKRKAARATAGKADKKKDQEDPSASIMDMMKQMYEDGDDDMKKTIAKAFTESRQRRQNGDDGFGSSGAFGGGSGSSGGLGSGGLGSGLDDLDGEDDDMWGDGGLGGGKGAFGASGGKGSGGNGASSVGSAASAATASSGAASGAGATDSDGPAQEAKEADSEEVGKGAGISLDPDTLH